MAKTDKADIYNLIEMNAIHSIALKPHFESIEVLDHVKPGQVSARHIIDEHVWGTYGKTGTAPCKAVKLVDCETEHLKNILRSQPQITSLTTLVIMAILMERKDMKKVRV